MQRLFYEKGLDVEVEGEQNIPHNRNTIVAANHASHLDMGLVKYALGTYGEDIVTLAAQDYFFEGNASQAYFENLTNLAPSIARTACAQASVRPARCSTRARRCSSSPRARARPPASGGVQSVVGYFALRHDVDILPVYVEGTYRSMPRGAFVPRNRNVAMRIGEVIPASVLKAATDAQGLRLSAACNKTVLVVQKAVEALRNRRAFHLERALDDALGRAKPNGHAHLNGNGHANGHGNGESESGKALREIFGDLEKRFQADSVKEPATFYFSLGEGKEAKWTVVVTREGCRS